VHGFYVHSNAKSNFEAISQKTGGRCQFLDVNSSEGKQILVDLVTEEVLRMTGGA